MSRNPFVNKLGDAIETAAERRIARRRRWMRRVLGGVALTALASSGVAVGTTVFSDSERIAAGVLYCYENEAMTGSSGIIRDSRPPAVACAEELGISMPLAVCDGGENNIAVVPTTRTCRELGMAALPVRFESARERVLDLERNVRRLEGTEDCIAPNDLADRVRGLLRRSNWTGWTVQVRDDLAQGPCGHALWLNGDGSRSLSFLPEERRILVAGERE